MGKTRNYNCKDVVMLMASRTIAETFKSKIAELSALRTNWTEQYADDLLARIDKAITQGLGTDAKKELRLATFNLTALQANAHRDALFLKKVITTGFSHNKPRRDEILRQLGYEKYQDGVNRKNQEALAALLIKIKENLTPALRSEITAQGTNPPLLDRIVGYADSFTMANSIQEGLKTSTMTVTQGLADQFNAIFDEISGICRIAAYYYQEERPLKAGFTFSKVVDNLGQQRKNTPEPVVS